MVLCPCKDCSMKGCGSYHDTCEPYQRFVKENEEERERRRNGRIEFHRRKPKKYW